MRLKGETKFCQGYTYIKIQFSENFCLFIEPTVGVLCKVLKRNMHQYKNIKKKNL